MKTFVLMMVSLLFAISSEAQNKSFYDFTVKTIDGKDFSLSSLKGKKVNVQQDSLINKSEMVNEVQLWLNMLKYENKM